MNGKPAEVQRLEIGDRIELEHRHNPKGFPCCAHWNKTEALVTNLVPGGGLIAIHWEKVGDPNVTGICVLNPEDTVKRFGHGLAAAA